MATLNDTSLGSDNSSGTTLSCADALNVTAGDLVFAALKWENADGATVTFDTGASTPTFTTANAVVDSTATDLHSASAYWVATSTGTVTVRAVLSAAKSFRALKAWSVTPGAGNTWALDATAATATTSGGSTSTPSSGSASATRAGVAFGMFGVYSSMTLTPGSGWSQPTEFNPTSFLCGEYRIVSGSGSLNADGTLSGSPHSISLLAIFGEVAGGTTITPTAGSLVISGSQPSLSTAFSRTPTAGSLVISGSSPTVSVGSSNTTITPTAGALVLSGSQPAQTLTVPSPTAAALVITGSQPVVSQGTGGVPSAGALSLSGSQPSLSFGTVITPAAGALVITGSQPSVSNSGATSFTITPAAGSLVLSGASPLQAIGVTPGAGSLVLSGASPSLDLGKTPTAGTLTLSGAQAGVTQAANITPSAGALVISGSQPAIQAPIDYVITPGCGSLAIAANQPQISNSTVVFLDTHDGFRKKKGKDKELERAQQFKEKQEKRRKALEDAISPPEIAKEPPKEPEKPVQPSIPLQIAANAEEVTTIVQDTEADDMEVINAFLRQLAAEEDELIQQLLKRA